jgi:hypothetical protein
MTPNEFEKLRRDMENSLGVEILLYERTLKHYSIKLPVLRGDTLPHLSLYLAELRQRATRLNEYFDRREMA